MSGTTTGRALRYPTATDRVTDGALAVEHLAEDVDAALVRLARKVAVVESAFVFGGGSTLTQTLAWPAGHFDAADVPLVLHSIRGAGLPKAISHQNAVATNTGVAITVHSVDGTALSGTIYVVAFGIVL